MSRGNVITLNDGNKIPIIGLGTANTRDMKVGEFRKIFEQAIEVGYRHFDTAWVYGSHKEIGEGIKTVTGKGGLTRDDIFITSKIWNTFHKKQSVLNNCKTSLEELGLEYVDLLLMHYPMGWKEGEHPMPADENGKYLYSDVDYLETWQGLEECRKNGWSRSIGVSNFNVNQLKRLLENCKIKPAINQVETHPYLPQENLINYCKQNEIVITAYSPLAAPYDRHQFCTQAEPNNVKLLDHPVIVQTAKNHGKTPAQVCLRWGIQRETVVIPKTVTKSRMVENLDLFSFELDDNEMQQINNLGCNWRAFSMEMFSDHPYFPYKD